MIFRRCQKSSLSFAQNIPHLYDVLFWTEIERGWDEKKETVYNVLRSMQISVGSRQSTWLREKWGGGGGLGYGNLGAGTALETEGNFLKYSCERCIQMAFSQWRVAVVVMLSLRKQPFYWGGGWSAHFNSRVFCRNFGQIFFIHRWPFSFNHEGCDKKIPPHIQGKGMVEDALFSKTSFNNQSADVKGTKWSTIKSWRGGGGLIKICRGRLFISSMDQGEERFQIS